MLFDSAVDRCTSENLLNLRKPGKLAGVALVADESPPSQPRFQGVRFQIIMFHVGTYEDLSKWNSCTDPPILKNMYLADIAHCPGKKGLGVSRIWQRSSLRGVVSKPLDIQAEQVKP